MKTLGPRALLRWQRLALALHPEPEGSAQESARCSICGTDQDSAHHSIWASDYHVFTVDDGIECPMCGGLGRIFDITEAINAAQAEGLALVPLRPPP